MKIIFCHTGRALLPELFAYTKFASLYGISCDVVSYNELSKVSFSEYDILWNFMGRDVSFYDYIKLKKNNCLYIKEFASCSVKPFPKLKNFIKSFSLKKADIEIYLNPLIESEFVKLFSKVPSFYRDMGVSDSFFAARELHSSAPKNYDFVYVGAMDDSRRISTELAKLVDKVECSVLLVGEPSLSEKSKLKDLPNVTITGRVPYEEVPNLLASAHIGLNIIPDEYPYNIQTSTKLIEYLALGIPVISNSYRWINEFVVQKEFSDSISIVDSFSDVNKIMFEELKKSSRSEPVLYQKTWDEVIKESGIFQYLIANIVVD
ncbi:MAG: glycosyltransferase [Pseudomonadota bacterium]|nr:glycosyltransferase [Pseudomonadota bacterium]